MKRTAALLVAAVVLAGCSSGKTNLTDDFVPIPQPQASPQPSDARLEQLQTSMTELLERIDVLNDRIAKLESGQMPAPAPSIAQPAAAPAPARPAAPAPVAAAAETPEPQRPIAAPSSTPTIDATQPQPQPRSESAALRGAALADSYRNALMLYGRNRITESRAAFQAIFDAEPTGDLADNALYWIGETYFAGGDYANAMRYYQRVVKEFADQNKAPDAMLKLGMTYAKTSDLALARQTFEDTIKRYPYSTAAASARLELKRIKY